MFKAIFSAVVAYLSETGPVNNDGSSIFTLKTPVDTINGSKMLSEYRNDNTKAYLVVNVASQCGKKNVHSSIYFQCLTFVSLYRID